MQVHIHKLCMIVDKSANINHVVSIENLTFAFLRNLPLMLVTYLIGWLKNGIFNFGSKELN
jgi:hypothetical protein